MYFDKRIFNQFQVSFKQNVYANALRDLLLRHSEVKVRK